MERIDGPLRTLICRQWTHSRASRAIVLQVVLYQTVTVRNVAEPEHCQGLFIDD